MRLTKADKNFLQIMIRHLELLLSVPPVGVDNKRYNAYRLLKQQEMPRLKRKIENSEEDE